MSWWNDFPHTKEYDQDLGWLIHEYKRLRKDVEELQGKVKTLEELYNTIPDIIAEETLKMENKVNAAIAEMENKVNTEINSIKDQMNEWMIQFNEMLDKMNDLYNMIFAFVANNNQQIKIWVQEKLDSFSKHYPYYIDPSDSKKEDLQTILYHMYNELSYGMPVIWFQGLQLTAHEYQNMEIPALYLQKFGRKIFRRYYEYRKCAYMFSPFTGEYVPISDVVLALARLHQNAVTAKEFEDAEITVQDFTDKEVTAYIMTWESVWFDELTA